MDENKGKKRDFKDILEGLDKETLGAILSRLSIRPEFQVLARKTQVKNSGAITDNEAEYDDRLTNRMEHSQQVSSCAGNIVNPERIEGDKTKEQIIAEIVGLCHDLGHTPFGHDAEVFFSQKIAGNDYAYSHAKYGSMMFENIWKEVINERDEEGNTIFGNISDLDDLGQYIQAGIRFHDSAYYAYQVDAAIAGKKTGNPKLDNLSAEELEQLKMAMSTPCIQAAMLADTVAIMQSDVRDLEESETQYSNENNKKKVISTEEMLEVAMHAGFKKEDIDRMFQQICGDGTKSYDNSKSEQENLKTLLDALCDMKVADIQEIIAKDIGRESNGRYTSIPDDYKLLMDRKKDDYAIKLLMEGRIDEYSKLTGIDKGKIDQKYIDEILKKPGRIEGVSYNQQYLDAELDKQRKELMSKNPLLCLTYEVQNEIQYNRILGTDRKKQLGNDVDKNRAIFNRSYDYVMGVLEGKIDDKELLQKLNKISENVKIVEYTGDKNKDIVMAYMQQMGNEDIHRFYESRIASMEKKLRL